MTTGATSSFLFSPPKAPALKRLLTCSDEEDAGAEEDVVGLVVNSAHPDAEAAQHQQAGAEDGEHAGGADDTCREIIDSSNLLEKRILFYNQTNRAHRVSN